MAFAGLNTVAILAAAIASFAFGSVWYMALAKPWKAAANLTEAGGKGGDGTGPSPIPFVIGFVAQLVMAWVLAGLIGHLGDGQVTVRNGVISGAFVWLGFVITTLATNHAFQGSKRALTLIDGGHWLGVLVIQGLVIGLVGV